VGFQILHRGFTWSQAVWRKISENPTSISQSEEWTFYMGEEDVVHDDYENVVKVYGLVVTRNECDRYLQACLAWHVPMLDGVLVYDDTSTDDTFNVVAPSGASYTVKPDVVPTFMEHEGRFRQDSLDALAICYELREGDWVFVIDTDEFVVADKGTRFDAIRAAASQAEKDGCKSVLIPRPELWNLDPPQVRVDGLWGGIKCTRLFRWEPGGRLNDKAMGCGNEPTYVAQNKIFTQSNVRMLHVGYVDENDRKEKFDRYSNLGNHGHNDKHINSILDSPTLVRYSGAMPTIWRGIQ
jgi:hypothetical protein